MSSATVHQLPRGDHRSWLLIKEAIAAQLRGMAYPDDVQAHVLEQLKNCYLRNMAPSSNPLRKEIDSAIAKGEKLHVKGDNVQRLFRWYWDIHWELLQEIVGLHIELYELRQRLGNTNPKTP
jgi:hypothetical protein